MRACARADAGPRPGTGSRARTASAGAANTSAGVQQLGRRAADPGDWSYQAGIARFGQPGGEVLLSLRCDRAAGAVEIARSGQAAVTVIVVRAEAMERSVAAGAVANQSPAIAARVAANDPLLDAMAFSKGRFAVEVAGLPSLYVPSYPEVTRVIEDCR